MILSSDNSVCFTCRSVVFLVDDWLASFDVRISPFVNLKITLNEEEIVKLGKKAEEQYPYCRLYTRRDILTQ